MYKFFTIILVLFCILAMAPMADQCNCTGQISYNGGLYPLAGETNVVNLSYWWTQDCAHPMRRFLPPTYKWRDTNNNFTEIEPTLELSGYNVVTQKWTTLTTFDLPDEAKGMVVEVKGECDECGLNKIISFINQVY